MIHFLDIPSPGFAADAGILVAGFDDPVSVAAHHENQRSHRLSRQERPPTVDAISATTTTISFITTTTTPLSATTTTTPAYPLVASIVHLSKPRHLLR